MTLARVLAAAVMLCALPAFAQDHANAGSVFSKGFYLFCLAPAATPEQPWRIIPSRPADLGLEQSPLSQIRTNEYRLVEREPDSHCLQYSPTIDQHSHTQLYTDTVCYAIRSYVVARDSKDSDSTHPVRYSTCQPAARYQLRTTEIRSGSGDR